jgi:DNA mismatch repair protein MutL
VEKSHILTEFYRIALVNSNVAFSFFDGDEEIYQLPPSNNKIRIENLFGKNAKKRWQQQLLTIETTTNLVSIYGYVGKPEYAQKSGSQYFFVNGRFMRHPYFHKAVLLAYNQMIQASESPNYFIYFEVDPQTIDINIHPTKTEIKFENEQSIWSILSATIKEALGKFNIVPSIDFDQEGALEMPAGMLIENVRPPQTNFNPDYNPFGTTNYKRPALDWEKLYGDFDKKNLPIESSPTWQPNLDLSITDSTSGQQQLIENTETSTLNFQYKNRYIFTGIKSGLLMIDQHRAHIRILYDLFLSQLENSRGISQQVLFPEVLELSKEDALFFEQVMPDLLKVGFEFEPLENFSFNVKGVSSHVGTTSVIDLLLDLLEKAKSTSLDPTVGLQESISLTLAESSALKSGQKLTNEEMNDMIDRLFACANHNFTPDGKKIMTIFTLDELEKRF